MASRYTLKIFIEAFKNKLQKKKTDKKETPQKQLGK